MPAKMKPPPKELGSSFGPSLDPKQLVCIGCNKHPRDLEEYQEMAIEEDISPESYVWLYEGTINRKNGHFACTPCYVELGCPVAPKGWRAP